MPPFFGLLEQVLCEAASPVCVLDVELPVGAPANPVWHGKVLRLSLPAIAKDRRINICRIVALRSAKAAFFRGAKGDIYCYAGPNSKANAVTRRFHPKTGCPAGCRQRPENPASLPNSLVGRPTTPLPRRPHPVWRLR
jgi:hypothetical protein